MRKQLKAVQTIATQKLEVVSTKTEDITDTFAGPPVYRALKMVAFSVNNCPKLEHCAIFSDNTKWNTLVEVTQSVTSKMPICGKFIDGKKALNFLLECFKSPGNSGPNNACAMNKQTINGSPNPRSAVRYRASALC